MPRIMAMLPTYNESLNIGPLMDAILALGPELEVLVVDDDSPDGTWRIVKERAETNPRIHLLHRTTNRGRGLAGIAGFREALRLGADWIIEMDADWSHDPKWIPSMIEASQHADVVIGSRLVPGGGEEGRPYHRQLITKLANLYIRRMVGLPARDATSGYRLFSRECMAALPWDSMSARGPEVVQEVLLAAHARGFHVVEVPIIFIERRAGASTFNKKIMLHSLGAMWRLRFSSGDLVPGSRTGARDNRLTGIPSALTIPVSWCYGLGRMVHRSIRQWRPSASRKLAVPVVCVGNLTVGGTGKTPFVRMLAQHFKNAGYKAAIISRGYRSTDKLTQPLIVSDGNNVLDTQGKGGDEPRWLAQHCPGVAVVVHPSRRQAGQLTIEKLGANLIIMDDGFQHDALARDLDIVLWDLRDEPRRMRLIPAGRLRERLGALRRAQAIVLTHGEYLPERSRRLHAARVIAQLKRHAAGLPIFEAQTLIAGYQRISGRFLNETILGDTKEANSFPWTGRRVIAVSGIARPESFAAMIRDSGGIVAHHFVYPDHHQYDVPEVDQWRDGMVKHEASFILTTAKDAVKLAELPHFGLRILSVDIEMKMKDEERWADFLKRGLNK